MSVQALEDTQQEGLQPADMVSLIQLLSLAADVPTQPPSDATNRSQDSIQELSQHFISVADTIISEDNTFKWQAIKEVAYTAPSHFFCSPAACLAPLCGALVDEGRAGKICAVYLLYLQYI